MVHQTHICVLREALKPAVLLIRVVFHLHICVLTEALKPAVLLIRGVFHLHICVLTEDLKPAVLLIRGVFHQFYSSGGSFTSSTHQGGLSPGVQLYLELGAALLEADSDDEEVISLQLFDLAVQLHQHLLK